MEIVCLDLEGVLVPEIWIAFAEKTGIMELKRTTRDEPDYEKLMAWRMDILRSHGLTLSDIQDIISQAQIHYTSRHSFRYLQGIRLSFDEAAGLAHYSLQ